LTFTTVTVEQDTKGHVTYEECLIHPFLFKMYSGCVGYMLFSIVKAYRFLFNMIVLKK